MISDLQSVITHRILILVLKAFNSAFPIFFIICSLLVAYLEGKKEVIKLGFFFLHALYFCGILKVLYRDGRPYFEQENIKALDICLPDYGHPSSHVFLTTIGAIIFFIQIYQYNTGTPKQMSFSKWCSLITALLFSVVGFAEVCFCRIAFGMHHLHQIILASFLGCYLCYLYWYCLDSFFSWMLNKVELKMLYKGSYTGFILVTIIYAFLGVFPSILILIRYPTPEQKNEWSKNFIAHCPRRFFYENFLGNASIISCGPIFTLIGYFIGVLLGHKCFGIQYKDFSTFRMSYCIKTIKFFIVCLQIIAVFLCFIFIPISNLYISYFIKFCLASLLAAFIWMAVLPILFRKINFLDADDFLELDDEEDRISTSKGFLLLHSFNFFRSS